jgi:hypothetical protein
MCGVGDLMRKPSSLAPSTGAGDKRHLENIGSDNWRSPRFWLDFIAGLRPGERAGDAAKLLHCGRGADVQHSNAADGLACDPGPPTPLSRRPYGAERPFPERVLLSCAAADSYVIRQLNHVLIRSTRGPAGNASLPAGHGSTVPSKAALHTDRDCKQGTWLTRSLPQSAPTCGG